MERTTDGGEALLQACRDLAVDYIFSSPGSEWAPVWEALARAQRDGTPGPQYLDLTHETLAVGMATGYTMITGRVQVVLLHAAAGLLQGANAIHGALLTGAAMVVCSGESTGYGEAAGPDPGSQWYRNLSVVGGPQAMAATFTKWSNTAADVSVVRAMVSRAGELARTAPAGPVYVNVPVEVLLAPWTATDTRHVAEPGSTVAADGDLVRAADLLSRASNPVIATESGGRTVEQWSALREFAETLGAVVVEPQAALCANFPRDHPLHGGADLARVAADADVLILVNCRAPWYPPSAKVGSAHVLVVDEVPHRPVMAYQVLDADTYVGGDVSLTMRKLTELLQARGLPDTTTNERTAAHADHHARTVGAIQAAAERSSSDPSGPVEPISLATALRRLVPADAVIVDETITHSGVLREHLMAEAPGRYHYVQGGLGQGTGIALGMKLALPERMIVFTVGDGSLLYNPFVQALMASRQLDLPILVVVFTNGLYLSMRHNHVRSYPDGAAKETGTFFGVSLEGQPDPAELAGVFGMTGLTVHTLDELEPALTAAVRSVTDGTTAVVNVHLNR